MQAAATSREGSAAGPAGAEDALVAAILDVVAGRCGVSFHAYRRPTVVRRILNRMASLGEPTLAAYADRLRRDHDEAARLLERLTLKVSRVWRNLDAVAALRTALTATPGRPLRAWSAGCARGEEGYTLAILLAEVSAGAGWSVVGTDVDPRALADARRGRYGPEALLEVPAEVALRHLGPPDREGRRTAGDALRAGARFALHDLVSAEAPPEGWPFDLVACRNVLIYLEAPARLRVEALLRTAVAPGGLLWLGEAEWPSAQLAADLEVVDRRARLFRANGGRG